MHQHAKYLRKRSMADLIKFSRTINQKKEVAVNLASPRSFVSHHCPGQAPLLKAAILLQKNRLQNISCLNTRRHQNEIERNGVK